MTKKRKLHQIPGIINHCWSGKVTAKQWKNQPFYLLIIQQQSLFTSKNEISIYAFANLVSPEIWKVLERENYKGKKYLFWCEKRTRGWRLKDWEEIG